MGTPTNRDTARILRDEIYWRERSAEVEEDISEPLEEVGKGEKESVSGLCSLKLTFEPCSAQPFDL